jgi:hypothetical protein
VIKPAILPRPSGGWSETVVNGVRVVVCKDTGGNWYSYAESSQWDEDGVFDCDDGGTFDEAAQNLVKYLASKGIELVVEAA